MADDTTALVALVVAIVALVVAAAQLTQQLLATAYVIRKCDRIVTGGLTKGGARQWHWRQFRFTVNYQAVVFALPPSIYSALGVSPTVQVRTPSLELWDKAVKRRDTRSTAAQGCWISLVQDLVKIHCLRPDDMCIKEESGDRIPDDLTVAPTRVDTLTVLLTCIALGMQVSKYSPTTGELALAGGVGGVSSSIHPVLGCLLHYSVFLSEPSLGFEHAEKCGHALRHEKGVWANAVFGRFRDRSYRPEFFTLDVLMDYNIPLLRSWGWPEDSCKDTIHGAACFMSFANVDVYEVIPSSVARSWCAHFAETIVKSHHIEIAKRGRMDADAFSFLPKPQPHAVQKFIDLHGCSSPCISWEDVIPKGGPSPEKEAASLEDLLGHLDCEDVLAIPDLITGLAIDWPKDPVTATNIAFDHQDPSDYVPKAVAWEIIKRADLCMRIIRMKSALSFTKFRELTSAVMVTATSPLCEVGAPSWAPYGEPSYETENFWCRTYPAACKKILSDRSDLLTEEDRRFGVDQFIRIYARLSILRAAYYTIMMRAACDIGPGLTPESRIDTALAYMA